MTLHFTRISSTTPHFNLRQAASVLTLTLKLSLGLHAVPMLNNGSLGDLLG